MMRINPSVTLRVTAPLLGEPYNRRPMTAPTQTGRRSAVPYTPFHINQTKEALFPAFSGSKAVVKPHPRKRTSMKADEGDVPSARKAGGARTLTVNFLITV